MPTSAPSFTIGEDAIRGSGGGNNPTVTDNEHDIQNFDP